MSQMNSLSASSGSGATTFRAAIERKDLAALLTTLAPDVTFHSPIVHQPYVGRDALAPLLAAVVEVLADFRYTDEFLSTDGAVLRFQAKIGTRDVDGVDILRFDAAGLVREFTVMVRPY